MLINLMILFVVIYLFFVNFIIKCHYYHTCHANFILCHDCHKMPPNCSYEKLC
ncbi:hypothetical protein MUK42_33928 [Musa troglodytarum]|uniref:Late nodulin n=1 Tax=Musa troglodytarum TaxID=320322 RepID=A0A9E7FBN5_9LILI|nr:hypothetical protein MUK42_33928 [Musa troglodytarum]